MGVKDGYQETEFGAFPADWDLVTVGDLFTFKNGLNKAKWSSPAEVVLRYV